MRWQVVMSLVLVAVACNGRLQPEEASRAARRAADLYPAEYLSLAPKFAPHALEEVLSADPSAQSAWRWLLCLMRDQVLANLLHAERQNVEEKVERLRAYNRTRRAR